jgi:hypothetical protein
MPLRSQPRGRRGTVGRPFSALNLRLALASFGLVGWAILAAVLFGFDLIVAAFISAGIALAAAVDLVVIQLRRRQRRREDDEHHSLFE